MKKISKIICLTILIIFLINILRIDIKKAEENQTNTQDFHTAENFKNNSEVTITCNRTRNDSKTTLMIKCNSDLMWSIDTRQAVDIKITSLVNDKKSDWIRLGEGLYGYAFNKAYTLDIDDNENYGDRYKISIRCVSWWLEKPKVELFYTEKIIDIHDTAIIRIGKIYILSPNDTNTIEVGNNLNLSVGFVEISKQPIIWESSDELIASVNQSGIVTGKKIGSVIIRAYTQDNKYIDEYQLDIIDKNNTDWIIRPDPTPYFILKYKVAVLLDNSTINLNTKNNSNKKDVSVFFSTLSTDIIPYPDGYDEDSYFICNWKSLNESVVKINGESKIILF